MAITNAQQYQQLVNKPGNGKRPGYRGSDMASVGTSTRAANTSQKDTSGADYGGGNQGRDAATSSGADDRSSALQTYNTKVATGRLSDEDYETFDDVPLNKREQELKNFLDRRNDVNLFGLSKIFTGPAQKFSDFNASINRPFFEKVIRAGKIPGLSFDMTEDELEDAYQNYMSSRLSGEIDAYGNLLNQGGDGPDQPIIPLMAQAPVTEETELDPDSLEGMLANRTAYRFMADGGRAALAEGGMPYEGGIMDLESGRQMYFLGKLVKKATRAVKKVVKSPIGKAALVAGLGYGLGGGTFFGKTLPGVGTGGGFSFRNILPNLMGVKESGGVGVGFEGILGKLGLTEGFGAIKPTVFGGITAASAIAGALTPEQEQEAQRIADETGIDIAEIRANPDKYLARRFRADGGIMRLGYQEGSKEPVAKKTMPLLDMGGKEMDLREDGGFVPLGRMERADDVPARLSKNEFVFTADAVRNAGDGDIDKGAEVMYNMMKNLESGGEVSEESQGLDGAREMFQTSQRLEEVL